MTGFFLFHAEPLKLHSNFNVTYLNLVSDYKAISDLFLNDPETTLGLSTSSTTLT